MQNSAGERGEITNPHFTVILYPLWFYVTPKITRTENQILKGTYFPFTFLFSPTVCIAMGLRNPSHRPGFHYVSHCTNTKWWESLASRAYSLGRDFLRSLKGCSMRAGSLTFFHSFDKIPILHIWHHFGYSHSLPCWREKINYKNLLWTPAGKQRTTFFKKGIFNKVVQDIT